jgi:hypothetical protein
MGRCCLCHFYSRSRRHHHQSIQFTVQVLTCTTLYHFCIGLNRANLRLSFDLRLLGGPDLGLRASLNLEWREEVEKTHDRDQCYENSMLPRGSTTTYALLRLYTYYILTLCMYCASRKKEKKCPNRITQSLVETVDDLLVRASNDAVRQTELPSCVSYKLQAS